MKLGLLLSSGIFLLISLTTHAAGFDCAKATSVTEKAICKDEGLSWLDSNLSDSWRRIPPGNPAAIKSAQLRWLKLRDSCGADVSCLSARYNERLDEISERFPVGTDQAGNRLEALIDGCTADKRLCVQLSQDSGDFSPVVYADDEQTPITYNLIVPSPDEHTYVGLWPRVLRARDGTMLLGVQYSAIWGYSGGGGGASHLRLFRVSRRGAEFHVRKVLSVPIEETELIRACFNILKESGEPVHNEAMRYKYGACHDEYEFDAMLSLDKTVKSGFPRLIYQTHATAFPNPRYRNSRELPLRKRDMVRAVYKACTYKHAFWLKGVFRLKDVYLPGQRPISECGSDYFDR